MALASEGKYSLFYFLSWMFIILKPFYKIGRFYNAIRNYGYVATYNGIIIYLKHTIAYSS
ncbi:hypothetical protein Aasi_1106 [Candidatus Amoebophilus asiaticus 5a2]|uniref:Uncharacterized protein n=1 Tax=Amoebophilus asiaticus (strain 5a2) TaxID=452471 RepID=B3ET97_AMOA5|nr:hypothetical protein Aasi_1106 [Candidatus Amoebophilus asiaticus 5a2]